jgi:cellobiose phosphorylase
MSARIVVAALLLTVAAGTRAHDFGPDLARYQQMAASKKLDSKEAIQARLSLERAQGQMDQADIKMLLRIRSLTNAGLRELGEQPAFLSSEYKRLEAALANPKTNDPAKIAKAREIFAQLAHEKPVYEALENEAVENMKQAIKLIESAPSK